MNLEYKHQGPQQIVQTGDWVLDAISYEEGAREKSTVFAPSAPPFDFLLPAHRYLSKKSNERAPVQFWMEILAYRLGCLFGVKVPPAFVSINDAGECRALIEWFYKDGSEFDLYIPGFTILKGIDPKLDKVKGTRHCLKLLYEAIEKVSARIESLKKEKRSNQNTCRLANKLNIDINDLYQGPLLIECFIKIFTFDALIANTDRHHENWGIILKLKNLNELKINEITLDEGIKILKSPVFLLSPAFDNGTALGYDYLEEKLPDYMQNPGWFENYANRGEHQLRLEAGGKRFKHDELIEVLLQNHPDCFSLVEEIISFKMDDVHTILNELVEFDAPVPFTEQRAKFTARIIEAKRNALVRVLEKCSQTTG